MILAWEPWDWGAHIMDGFHQFLKLGLPTEITPLRLDGHNPLFFPQASTLEFRFPARDSMPPVKVTWYDGKQNHPLVPTSYGNIATRKDIPAVDGRVMPAQELPAGKEIYGKDWTFKGHSHGSTLSILEKEKAADLPKDLLDYPRNPTNHYANFLKACKGLEPCLSPFEVAAPLSQVFCLGWLHNDSMRAWSLTPSRKKSPIMRPPTNGFVELRHARVGSLSTNLHELESTPGPKSAQVDGTYGPHGSGYIAGCFDTWLPPQAIA